ncbi:GntR family transcriptional regulator [Pelomonas aquatica]|jgi:DNA-binding GntR family transcriptional regulator|uniref:GntR family transcriptional regulator n=1 Tax=Pelomonas aquatica TaxID=431058 RepID=A0A9X4LI34_9BURK|nr:GntR family transcriptional regulator [Pelomonas aquatica]MCY4756465.1 GntR family transcriptional regulator [Pelomonas aquatica]MDG0863079.1 GntR family transcriptional regulator [Pelomonas aquatica]
MTDRHAAPLASTALYEQVADRLRQRILGRELEPGSWIDELKLCGELGISRTPLREALKVLAAEGLVTMKLRRGAYVTEMSERDVREAYQLLSLLESDAAAEVASRATNAELAELGQLHRELEDALPDQDRFFAANERFHLRVLEIDGNRWRLQIVGDLRRLMKLNRHHSLFREGRLAESLDEHRAIVAALLARDAQACRSLVSAHFRNGLSATQAAA